MGTHAEIMYDSPAGGIHSDVCPPKCEPVFTPEYRKFLHDCLDEYLDKSKGTGIFYIGNTDDAKAYFTED
jgi:hypothetical protein